MDNALTWTQFATVMGMLTALAGITLGVAAYFFKQWQESAFELVYQRLDTIEGRLTQRLDAIDRRLDWMEAKMVTKDDLRAVLAELELRLRGEPTPPAQEA